MTLITAELQWLEHLWNHKICSRQGQFELLNVTKCIHSARTRDIIGIIVFSSFSNMKVCCVFSLESPHRGDSNENTQHIIINIKKKRKSPAFMPNTIMSVGSGIFCYGLKNEFEIAVVKEPSMFEPLI